MRKTLLFLFMLPVICATAQKQTSVTFDFSNPTSLTPSVTPKTDAGGSIMTTTMVFKEGPISISFSAGSEGTGTKIMTVYDKPTNVPYYFLRITRTAGMKVSGSSNATLDRMVLEGEKGDLALKLYTNQPGTLEGKVWSKNSNENNIINVSFENYGSFTNINKLTVYYTTPSDILKPLTSTISNGDELPSFENLVLTFDRSMTVASTEGMTLTRILEEGNEETALTASASGSEVAISADKKIEKNGTYKITIPARCLKDADGWENTALEYTFTINVPKNTFEYVSVEPAPGRVEAIQSGIKLTFASKVSNLDEDLSPIRMFKDEEETPHRLLNIEKDTEDENSVVLNFLNNLADITENGTYKITIPEGYIYNTLKGDTEFERYNPETVLTYVISDEPEPLPEPDPVEIECTLSPVTSDGSVATLTLAFAEGSDVTLAENATGAYFTDATENNIGDAAITAAVDGTFLVNIAALSFGNYILNIPEGMFTTNTEDDRTAKVKAISKSFTIERIDASDFNYDFFFSTDDIPEYVEDTYLNNVTIYSSKQMYADANKTIVLVDYENKSNIIARGHFVAASTEQAGKNALRIMLDTPVSTGLKHGKYTFIIEAATIGDSNFEKYINGNYNIDKKDCHVNPDMTLTFNVDNDKATSIEGIEADKDTDMRIYNILGQPVKSMDAPGVYIVNGKKYIKK